MLIEETFIDATDYDATDQKSVFGKSEPHEPYTDHPGDLFRDLQREYGRCTGHVYQDTISRGTIAIGWVFLGRQRYDGSNKTYLREVWVTLFDECEHGDPLELTKGGKPTGLKHHVLKQA